MSDIVHSLDHFERGWTGGLPETPCGHGSTLESTVLQRQWLSEIVKRFRINTVADIGAGDLNWIRSMKWNVDYRAYDVIPRHSDVERFDIVRQIPPRVDLLMCLWVLNHLSYDACLAAIVNLRASGSKYLLITDRPRCRDEQPPEVDMPAIDTLELNQKGDCIKLCALS